MLPSRKLTQKTQINLFLLLLLVKGNGRLRSLIVPSQNQNLGMYLIYLSLKIFSNCLYYSAHIARWCAESNRPLRIVKDAQFEVLMKAGRPTTYISSPSTVSRDIKTMFELTRQRIDGMLKVIKSNCSIFRCKLLTIVILVES